MPDLFNVQRRDLETLVEQIRYILWMDEETKQWDLDKSWNMETMDEIVSVFQEWGLAPEENKQ